VVCLPAAASRPFRDLFLPSRFKIFRGTDEVYLVIEGSNTRPLDIGEVTSVQAKVTALQKSQISQKMCGEVNIGLWPLIQHHNAERRHDILDLEPSILVRDIDFLSMAEKSSSRWRRLGNVVPWRARAKCTHGNLSVIGPRGKSIQGPMAGACRCPTALEIGVLAAFADASDLWQGLILDIPDVVRFVLITYNTSGSVFLWVPQGKASLVQASWTPPSIVSLIYPDELIRDVLRVRVFVIYSFVGMLFTCQASGSDDQRRLLSQLPDSVHEGDIHDAGICTLEQLCSMNSGQSIAHGDDRDERLFAGRAVCQAMTLCLDSVDMPAEMVLVPCGARVSL
jgi:hypothetical protein